MVGDTKVKVPDKTEDLINRRLPPVAKTLSTSSTLKNLYKSFAFVLLVKSRFGVASVPLGVHHI